VRLSDDDVLPARSEQDLSEDELRSLLAHELAHLVAASVVLLVSRLICSCCGFSRQPSGAGAVAACGDTCATPWAVSRTEAGSRWHGASPKSRAGEPPADWCRVRWRDRPAFGACRANRAARRRCAALRPWSESACAEEAGGAGCGVLIGCRGFGPRIMCRRTRRVAEASAIAELEISCSRSLR